ncbi:MAG TPA: FMN-binding negative transcriptional regulator [Aliidongia sp.]|uniref:FMN-binding negative transcriptional regulator n=1 Tax=Aliidongia sp. TaxID=1914230 RepID=UPI002DDCE165|nr:FMN-binding negative transcriptional regulator [Aliidongia sp.]HEV2674673.1 FMN-binding negative transcriptional regulator [Aliidongia sp.]
MYVPSQFKQSDLAVLHEAMRGAGLVTLVSLGADGLVASHVPMLLDADDGPNGTLVGHLAKPNPQGRGVAAGVEALAIFQGPDAYITPSWYATKREHGKVVPTWNYVAIHAYGPLEFFDDADRLLDVVTRLTNRHEGPRTSPWAVTDAPPEFIQAHLKGIVGFRLPISRIDGKWKMSQNRPLADRTGVADGLRAEDRDAVAVLVPEA